MCNCKKTTYVYSCQHQKEKHASCWQASMRKANLCLGPLLPSCRKTSEEKHRYGFCPQCQSYFHTPRNADPKVYVERYLKYKEDMGWTGKKVSPEEIPLQVIFDIFDMMKVHRQSPMETKKQPVASCPNQGPETSLFGSFAESNGSRSPFLQGEIIDLSDITSQVEGHEPFSSPNAGDVNGGEHSDSVMLNIYRESSIRTTTLEHIEASSLPVPKISCPPPPRNSSPYVIIAQPSVISFKEQIHSPSQRIHVPIPPPQPLDAIFIGCTRHGRRRARGCSQCQDNVFEERGVPPEEYTKRRSAQSVLVSVHSPNSVFTCAPQATCICVQMGEEHCIACLERNRLSKELNSCFI